MLELARISAEIRRMFDGQPWHGPGVLEALRGVTAGMAAARPLPGAHSIFELTHHIAAWMGEVTSRLQGKRAGMPAEGDFPAEGHVVNADTWQEVQDRLVAAQQGLLSAVAAFDEGRLHDLVSPDREQPPGDGVTFYVMLQGIVQHNAYHAGQIVLLKKSLG